MASHAGEDTASYVVQPSVKIGFQMLRRGTSDSLQPGVRLSSNLAHESYLPASRNWPATRCLVARVTVQF